MPTKMTLFQGNFHAPSWHTCTALACGWALAGDRHTITTYVWLTGATTVKHFARFSVSLGCPLSHQRWQLWGAVIRLAARVCLCAVIGPGTARKWPQVNSTRRRPVGRPSMRPAVFPYHGSSLIWPKITRSLKMFCLSPHRARNE